MPFIHSPLFLRKSLLPVLFVGVICFAFPRCLWSQASVNEGLETVSIYVDGVHGSDSNNGTQNAPLKTIGAAVDTAMGNNQDSIGSRVIIQAGTYRESVLIAGTKRSTTLPITFQAATNGTVLISGADVITGWTAYSGNTKIFHASWPYNFGVCPAAPPPAPPQQEIVLRAEMMVVNGKPLTQVLSLISMQPGTFYIDDAHAAAYVYPPAGTNMSIAVVEAAARPTLLHEVGQSYVVFRGLTFQYANTCHGDAAVKVDSDAINVLFDQDNIVWNNAMGISFATVEHFTVQNSTAHHNGELGFHTHQAKFDLWQSNVSNYNNWRGAQGAFYTWDTGGAKYMWDHSGTYKNVGAFFNQANGISWDTDQQNVSVTGLVAADNIGNGVQIEKTEGPFSVAQSFVCYSNLIGVSQRGGIAVRNSPQVTIEGTAMFGNVTNQLAVVGQPGGIEITNWETGQSYNLITENFTSTGNVLFSTVPNLFSDSYLGDADWTAFVSTLHSDSNKYWAGPASSIPAFVLPGATSVDLAGWKSATGQDAGSSWASSTAPPACTVPSDSPDFWLTTGDYAGVPLDVTGHASFHLDAFSLGGLTGNAKLTADGVSSVPGLTASFNPATISTTGSSIFTVAAAPATKPGTYSVAVLGNLGNITRTVTVWLVVPQSAVRLSASSLAFADQTVNKTSAPKLVTLTNTGKSALSISSITTKGNYAQTNGCGSSLKAGGSCQISITFTPKVAGETAGVLSITDSDGTSPQRVTLSGTGLGAAKISISPIALSFGAQKVGTTSTVKTLTLKNVGTATLTITKMTISGADGGDFSKSSSCGSTVAVGASCTVQVKFAPAAKGARTATLSIYDNDGYNVSPQTVALMGTGT